MNMPKYVSRQTEVEADEIVAIDLRAHDLSLTLELAGGGRCVIPAPRGTQHRPFPGDYLIHLAEHNDTYVCPRAVFLEKYRPARAGELTFGEAIEALKRGAKVAREGWNGKGMWLALSPGHQALEANKFWAGPNRKYAEQAGGSVEVLPSITIKTADGKILMGWLASQTDMLAEDWRVIE